MAMLKFMAGGVGLARCGVSKEEVNYGSLGASGATFKELKTSPEVLREFDREFSCAFLFYEFFVLKYRSQNSLEKITGSLGDIFGHMSRHILGHIFGNTSGTLHQNLHQTGALTRYRTSEGCNQSGAN